MLSSLSQRYFAYSLCGFRSIWSCSVGIIIFLGFISGSIVRADEVPAIKQIYVVSMQEVLDKSIPGKAAKKSLEKEALKTRGKVESAERDLEAEKKALEKQQSLLSSDAFEKKMDALRKKQVELGRMVNDEREQLETKRNTSIKKVVEEVEKILPTLAEERKSPIVIERDPRLVLYVNPEFDMTEELIKRVDKRRISF